MSFFIVADLLQMKSLPLTLHDKIHRYCLAPSKVETRDILNVALEIIATNNGIADIEKIHLQTSNAR